MFIDYCPFCGEDQQISLKFSKHRLGMSASVKCGHCAAQGGSFIEEDKELAAESALRDWNQNSLRPKTLCDCVEHFVGQLQYDIRSYWYKIKHWDF
jgi:hypothetical protein